MLAFPKNKKMEKSIKIKISIPKNKRSNFQREGKIFLKNLEGFLHTPVWDRKNLGKSYYWINFWNKFFSRSLIWFRKTFVVVGKFSYYSIVFALATTLVYSLIPGALSAPKSVTVTTKADFEQGQFSGVTNKNSTDSIQLSPSGSWTARVWTPPEDLISYGHTSVMVDDYLYVFRGYAGNAFWRYDTVNNVWNSLQDLPQPAYYGADMTYNENSGKIYAIFGGYSQKFYSYDIENNEWTKLNDLLDTPWTGASLESGGNSIFAVRGNGSTDFWEYRINEGIWRGRAPISLTVGQGSDLVNGQDGNLYAVRGANTLNFYRFNISANRWFTTSSAGPALASIPSSGCSNGSCTMNGEQKGVYWNGSLYFMRSNGLTDFLRYNISGNAWTILTTDPTPQAVNYGSLTLNTREDYIYAFRANGTTDFWKFDPDGNAGQRWIGPKQVSNGSTLMPVGTGGDLLWNRQTGASNYVYALQGNNTANLYRYDVTNNNWSTITASPALGFNLNNDTKGAVNTSGNLYTIRNGNANVVYIFNGTGWSAMSPQPSSANAGEGAGLAFVGNDLYYMRGGGSACMYRYSSGAWSGCMNISFIESGTTTTYYPNIGARILSNGTDIFVMPGDGETAFLKYTVSSGTWSKLTATPFSQYYGTDMTYNSNNSKIYALAGFYKDETWEYDILGNSWRRIPNNQKFTFGRGPYNGASIEFAGGSSIFATIGQGVAVPSASADIWSFTVPATNYPTSGTNTYTSHRIDLGQVSSGTSFGFNENKPANTNVVYEICSNSEGENCTSWHDVSDGNISDHDGFSLESYAWVRATLSTSDGASTPTVFDYTISYSSSDTVPSIPNTLVSKSDQNGEVILPETEYAYEHPYFSWSNGTDNGSGINGYYVYWGKNSSADPASEGTYQTVNHYLVNEAMTYDTDPVRSYGTYYLIIKAKDNNGLVSDSWSAFTYRYSGVSPFQNFSKTNQDHFNQSGADFDGGKVSYSAVDGSLRLNNVSGFWNQSRLSASPYSTTIGGRLASGGCKTAGQNQLNGNHCLYTFQGNNQLIFMRYEIETDTWTNSTASPLEIGPAPLGIYNGGAITEGPEGYLYATRGASQPTFWRYDIANRNWSELDDAPKIFTYGSFLVYDGSRYIYAMPGNDDAFYRYDTCNGQGGECDPEWIQLTNANFGNPNTVDGQRTYEGADGIYDGRNNVYVMQGNYYPYFAKYSISDNAGYGEVSNTWTPLSAAPTGFYNGGSLEFDGDHTIYALAGNSRMKFLKYDMNNDTWSFLPDAPATISYGASLKYYNGYIYANRGGSSTAFYRFNTTDNTWEIPNRDFFGPHNVDGTIYFPFSYGALMADDGDGNVYLGRGGYDNTFGKYETKSGSFTALSNLPLGAYNGSNIVYNETEDSIYYVSGNGVRTRRSGADSMNPYFYKYNVNMNSWLEITADRPPAQLSAGSSMTYDGSRYIYLTQGNSTTTWWRYDTQGVEGSRWTAMPTAGSCSSGNGSKILYKGGDIYKIQSGGSTTNCKYSVSGGTWSTLGVLPGTANYGSALMDGKDGYIYVSRGGNTNNYYRYNISQASPGSWENLTNANVPAQVTYGGIGTNVSNRNWIVSGSGGGTTYGDGLYSYVVGSSSNGTGFERTGTYTSETIDLTQVYKFANLTANYVLPEKTSLEIQTRTSSNGSTWGSWSSVSNDQTLGNKHVFKINSNSNRYIQVRMIFSSSDQVYSPRLDDYTINYYQDIEAPVNPTSISAYKRSDKVDLITTDVWYNSTAPYFEWPDENVSGGAVDNQGGSGIAGYYVYFGTEMNGEPSSFQTENNYSASGLSSGQTYYLNIQAVDNAGMIPTESYRAFIYKFDSTSPITPTGLSVNPTGYSSTDSFEFIWNDDASDIHSGIDVIEWCTDCDPIQHMEDIVWNELPAGTVTVSVPPYRPNTNIFYLRIKDIAGNASSYIYKDYYYSGGASSPPRNLSVDPANEDNEINDFTFTWDLPESYSGDSSKIKYYYSVNVLPTAHNTTETTARAAGPGPYATQYGKNTFYVVALNEGGVKTNPTDIDWNNPAQVDFYAETTAPGPPNNIQIFDTSDRESQEYSVALKWSVPTSYDPGNFAGYAIYRSEDNVTFSEVATTTGSAYVDTGLESKLYYYYAKSKDKTNNYSVATSTVNLIPTGRYTSPPLIVSQPKLTIQAYAMNAIWSTNRVASSFVEFGKTITLGETNGQVDSVTDHSVNVTGLSAGTKYYYRVKYIDPDGNIGTSDIDTFETLPPPTISDVSITDVGLNSATISWTTNTSAKCTLKYGKGSYTSTIEEGAGSTSHVQKIAGLESNTTYNFQIDAIDTDLNTFNSDEYTFTTLQQPVVSEFMVDNKDNVDVPTIVVNYKTSHATTTLVKFKAPSEGSYHNYLVNEYSTEHTAEIADLDPAVEYEIIATGLDSNGVEAASQTARVTTLTDSRPPGIISNRAVGRVVGRGEDAKANLYVRIETDEASKTQVFFGKGTVLNNFEQNTPEDASNTYHLITIPVDPGQVYSYIVKAKDEAGNETITKPVTVVVESSKENATEIVVNTFGNKFGWITKIWMRQ